MLNRNHIHRSILAAAGLFWLAGPLIAQNPAVPIVRTDASSALYLDVQNGMTADQAVALALENNGELQALRKEADAAGSLVKQAGLRANPKLNATGTKQI